MHDVVPVSSTWSQDPPNASATSPIEMVFGILRLARRQILLILSSALAVMLVGAAYVWTTPPVYTAEASIMVETRKVQLFSQPAVLDDSMVDGGAFESQIQLLRSDRIAATVVDRLQLAQDPEFVEPPPGLLMRIRRLVERFRPGTFPPEPHTVATSEQLRKAASQALQNHLDVNRLGSSFGIEIRAQSSNPVMAATIANATAEAYIADQRQAKADASAGAAAWMRERLRELRDQSAAADQAVLDYRQNNKIVISKGQRLDDQKLGDLNSQASAAREQTIAAQAKLDRIDAVIAADATDPGRGATVSDALVNPLITNLRSRYLELSGRLNDWSARFGANHLAVVDLRRQLEDVRRLTLTELKRLAETYRSDFEIAKQKQSAIEAQLQDSIADSRSINEAQSSLKQLESAAQTYRTLYDSLLQRYSESAQQQSFPIGDAQFLNEATPPNGKSKPKTKLILGASIVAGILLGFGIGFVREMFERVFRTSEQVETALQAECLAMVPAVSKRHTRRRKVSPYGEILQSSAHLDGRLSDAIRAIKSSIDHSRGGRTQVIGLTSALPDEGKSLTALELAILIAEVGGRVVVVDCDLRNPSLSRKVAGAARHDLTEVVSGRYRLEDALWTDPNTGVTVLPGCLRRSPVHSAEVLSLPATGQIFDRLRSDFDYVIVDLPPLLAFVDVRASSLFVDTYALVIAWGQTRIDVVEHALKSVRAVRDRLLGVILTKVDVRRLRRYEGDRRRYPDTLSGGERDKAFAGVYRRDLDSDHVGLAVSKS